MQQDQAVRQFRTIVVLYSIAIVCCIMAQIEAISSVARIAMYAIWMALTGYMILCHRGKVVLGGAGKLMVTLFALLAVICIVLSVFQGTHLNSSYLAALPIPILVYIVSYNLLNGFTREVINKLAIVYIWCTVALAVVLLVTYVPSYQAWMQAETYIMTQKNSAAQIFISAAFLAWFFVEKKTIFYKILYLIVGAILCVATAVFQCRTALLGLCLALGVYVLYYAKRKGLILFLIILAAGYCISNDTIWGFFQQALMLEKYNSADLNTISSGRIGFYLEAFQAFESHVFFGTGIYHVDDLYICILAELGLVGMVCILPMWIQRIWLTVRGMRNKEDCLRKTLVLLTAFYFVESLLERLPPFGPGVCSFMFWILSAFLDTEDDAIQLEECKTSC